MTIKTPARIASEFLYGCVRPKCDVVWDVIYWGISYALFWPVG